jgi:hypothetical protein
MEPGISNVRRWSVAVAVILLVIAALIYSQRKAANSKSQIARQAIMAALCSGRERLLIGVEIDAEARSYVDTCNGSIDHNMITSDHSSGYHEFDYRSQVSTDGKWRIQIDKNKATFSSLERDFTVSLNDAVSPLRWSPSDDFVFYVGKSATLSHLPLSECLDDSFLIHVIDTRNQSDEVVSKVCAGFPYWSLSWLQKPAI